MPENAFNPYLMAQAQLDRAAAALELDEATRLLLREPLREYTFAIPVRMDDGHVQVFRGVRVQHNDARGPCKGGIRFHFTGTPDLVRAMAMWMSWKCAVIDLPLGGASGAVSCDPHSLSAGEQERLCRGWVRQLSRELGPIVDVPEPDLATGPRHMLWMLDEYEAIHRGKYPGFITGKPVGMGGSLGRIEATGYGLVFVLREALKELGLKPEHTVVSLQGFGKVGAAAARLLARMGVRIAAVAAWSPAEGTALCCLAEDGIDVEALSRCADGFGHIDRARAEAAGFRVAPGGAWLEQEADVLIPAALENQIGAAQVERIHRRVKLVVEGANGPVTAEADQVLAGRGITVIPDSVASGGGVTCSYFEQIQSNTNYYWDMDEVLGKLDVKLTAAYLAVGELARKRSLPLREAALLMGIHRVAQACRERGWT